MGERVANQLLSPNMLNYIELSKEYNIEEIILPMSMKGKSLRELDLRAKYNISVIAIVSNGEIIIAPSPDQDIHEKDMLLVVGNKEDLAVFANIE
jgi:trk system potassium uptake protein TrkA